VLNTACDGGTCINGTCHAACQTDAQCGPKDRCDNGLCTADDRPHPSCKTNSDCANGQMCVDGTCRTGCAFSSDCCSCGGATVCHGGFCVTPGEADPVCSGATDCGASQACVDAVCL
jgi:hypothetical protein